MRYNNMCSPQIVVIHRYKEARSCPPPLFPLKDAHDDCFIDRIQPNTIWTRTNINLYYN